MDILGRRVDLTKKGRLSVPLPASPGFNGSVKARGGLAGWANWVRWADELDGLVGFAWMAGSFFFASLWKSAFRFFHFVQCFFIVMSF